MEPMLEEVHICQCDSPSFKLHCESKVLHFFSFSLSYSILPREIGVLVLEKVNLGDEARKPTVIRLRCFREESC